MLDFVSCCVKMSKENGKLKGGQPRVRIPASPLYLFDKYKERKCRT